MDREVLRRWALDLLILGPSAIVLAILITTCAGT